MVKASRVRLTHRRQILSTVQGSMRANWNSHEQ